MNPRCFLAFVMAITALEITSRRKRYTQVSAPRYDVAVFSRRDEVGRNVIIAIPPLWDAARILGNRARDLGPEERHGIFYLFRIGHHRQPSQNRRLASPLSPPEE